MCHCAAASGADTSILKILEQQLARCGPENLAKGTGWSSAALLAAGLVGLVLGAFLAAAAALRAAGGPRPARGVAGEPALAIEAPVAPPATDDRIGEIAKAQLEELRRRRNGGSR